MGNSCSCANNSDELNQDLNGEHTSRVQTKPEKLPTIHNSIKDTFQKIRQEKNEYYKKDIQVHNQHLNSNNSSGQGNHKENNFQQLVINNQKSDSKVIVGPTQKNNFDAQQNRQLSIPNQEAQQSRQKDLEEGKAEQSINSQNNLPSSAQQKIDPLKLKNIYEKLGGETGCQIFVDKIITKVLADPTLKIFFAKTNMTLFRDKFQNYIGYLTGGKENQIVQNLQAIHKNMRISDSLFDQFVSHCVQSMKEMRVKQDCLRDMVKVLQNMRDQIVHKPPPEEEPPKTLYERLGGKNNIKLLTERSMEKILECPHLKPFFDSTPIGLHQKRVASYLTSLLNKNEPEWLGKSLKHAHLDKQIGQLQFDVFVQYMEESIRELELADEETIQEFVELLKGLKNDILSQQKPEESLFDKIDKNDFFEPVMNRFIDKMMKDHILGRYFTNMKMKHMIPNKIMLFFAYQKGIMNPNEHLSIQEYHSHLKITPEDFERSIIFFKESLYEFCIDPIIVDEAVAFYKTLKKVLSYNPDDHVEEIKKQGFQNQEDSNHYKAPHMLDQQQFNHPHQFAENSRPPFLGPNSNLLQQEKNNMNADNEVKKDQLKSLLQSNPLQNLKQAIYNNQSEKESQNKISSFKLESENQNNFQSSVVSSDEEHSQQQQNHHPLDNQNNHNNDAEEVQQQNNNDEQQRFQQIQKENFNIQIERLSQNVSNNMKLLNSHNAIDQQQLQNQQQQSQEISLMIQNQANNNQDLKPSNVTQTPDLTPNDNNQLLQNQLKKISAIEEEIKQDHVEDKQNKDLSIQQNKESSKNLQKLNSNDNVNISIKKESSKKIILNNSNDANKNNLEEKSNQKDLFLEIQQEDQKNSQESKMMINESQNISNSQSLKQELQKRDENNSINQKQLQQQKDLTQELENKNQQLKELINIKSGLKSGEISQKNSSKSLVNNNQNQIQEDKQAPKETVAEINMQQDEEQEEENKVAENVIVSKQPISQNQQKINLSQTQQVQEKKKNQQGNINIGYKYYFQDLLNDDKTKLAQEAQNYQGELNRFMDKQKTQLPRWLILNSRALLIYKDEINAKSFPTKPLYAIPLPEIKDVTIREALIHPNQRKSQALHFLDIQLTQCYGIIAQSISQLLTGKTVLMGNNYSQRVENQLVESNNKVNTKKKPITQNHSYDDELLIFVSQTKKPVVEWQRRIKTNLKLIPQQKVNENINLDLKNIIEKRGINNQIIDSKQQSQRLSQHRQNKNNVSQIQQEEERISLEQKLILQNDRDHKVFEAMQQMDIKLSQEIAAYIQNINAQQINNEEWTNDIIQILRDKLNLDDTKFLQIKDLIFKNDEVQNDYKAQDEGEDSNGLNTSQIESLYQRLGGEKAIQDISDGMFVKISKDQKLQEYFYSTEEAQEIQKLFLIFISNGPISIKNNLSNNSDEQQNSNLNPLIRMHQERGLKKIEFDKIAGYLVTTLNELNIAKDLINELILNVFSMRDQFSD